MKIHLLSINYAPERTGIAPYSTGLAEHLAQSHEVTVITGLPHYPDWRVAKEDRCWRRNSIVNGVAVRRLGHYVPSRPSVLHRAAYEATWAAQVCGATKHSTADLVVAVVPALLSGAVGARLARRSGANFGLIVQDVMSSAASQVGMRHSAWTTAATSHLERDALRHANGIVTIHDRLADILRKNASCPVDVIPNWSHVTTPPPDGGQFRRSLGWRDDEIIVLHSGNMGLKQGLDNVVDAAWHAERTDLNVKFVLAGGGSQQTTLADRGAGCRQLIMMNSVSDADYMRLLAAADVLLINERPGMTEMSLPSKLTSYLQTGRPILAATDAASVTAAFVGKIGGDLIPAGRPSMLAQAIQPIIAEATDGRALRSRRAALAAAELTPTAALNRYSEWVDQLTHDRPNSLRRHTVPAINGLLDSTGELRTAFAPSA